MESVRLGYLLLVVFWSFFGGGHTCPHVETLVTIEQNAMLKRGGHATAISSEEGFATRENYDRITAGQVQYF